MKKLSVVMMLILFGCVSQRQINPCEDIVSIQKNPDILKDCFPNYTAFGIGEGTSPRDSIAIMKATMNSQSDLLRNLKAAHVISQKDSLGNTRVKTSISGVLNNTIHLKTFLYKEEGRYISIVITTGTLGKNSNIINTDALKSITLKESSSCHSSDVYNAKLIPHETPPKPLIPISPVYPEIAQEAGIEGTVYIQFFIDDKGNVAEACVSIGIPNTGLNEAAIDAVKKSKWKPAQQGGENVGTWQMLPVIYKLTYEKTKNQGLYKD